ncbi:phosphatase inhibitor-domain-containing protein [Jimgerdemannia flammicorona]|uniref:Type 1 phosphatases regulator n=1 Tax=Jimgerdemannia flammicorona TaxID=994334 RepID=A0A433DIM0_9FUNG|nr:phosphatase inhibitor-domain-containing protein [Jimgerdemannia flammicorona]
MAGNMTRTRTQGPIPASYASRTLILDPTETPEQGEGSAEDGSQSTSSVGILRLRGDLSARASRKIKWDDKVVDNEGMGKKKSKICCIYHKVRPFGESSDESDSDSDSDSGSDSDSDRARPMTVTTIITTARPSGRTLELRAPMRTRGSRDINVSI